MASHWVWGHRHNPCPHGDVLSDACPRGGLVWLGSASAEVSSPQWSRFKSHQGSELVRLQCRSEFQRPFRTPTLPFLPLGLGREQPPSSPSSATYTSLSSVIQHVSMGHDEFHTLVEISESFCLIPFHFTPCFSVNKLKALS